MFLWRGQMGNVMSFILFHVILSPQDPATSRTLTLISKTIQTLGSLAKSKSVSSSDESVLFFLRSCD